MRFVKAVSIALLFLAATNSAAVDRWYKQTIVDQGAQLFHQYGAVCHGVQAEGTAD